MSVFEAYYMLEFFYTDEQNYKISVRYARVLQLKK